MTILFMKHKMLSDTQDLPCGGFLAHVPAANEEAKEQRELRVRKGEVDGMMGFLERFRASSRSFSLQPLTVTRTFPGV